MTDDLLQGVQGLLLTFHVAAQKLAEDHASKKLMDHALSEADELISDGRRRFEEVAFHRGAEAHAGRNGIRRTTLPADLKNRYPGDETKECEDR